MDGRDIVVVVVNCCACICCYIFNSVEWHFREDQALFKSCASSNVLNALTTELVCETLSTETVVQVQGFDYNLCIFYVFLLFACLGTSQRFSNCGEFGERTVRKKNDVR
jgi:hypothetical protein